MAIAAGSESGPVVEDATVAAVGGIPDRIPPRGLRELAIVGRQVTVAIDRGTEHDTVGEPQHRLLDHRKDAVGERDVTCQVLLRIAPRDRAVVRVEQIIERNLAPLDGALEQRRNLGRGRLDLLDER